MNNLVDEYNNTYHRSSGRKPIYADYSALTGETESSHKAPNLMLKKKSRLLTTRIFLVEVTPKISWKKHLRFVMFWWLILGRIKLKI